MAFTLEQIKEHKAKLRAATEKQRERKRRALQLLTKYIERGEAAEYTLGVVGERFGYKRATLVTYGKGIIRTINRRATYPVHSIGLMYRGGYLFSQILEETNMEPHALNQILFNIFGRDRIMKDRKEAAESMFEHGLKMKDVCEALGLTPYGVKYVLKTF